MTLYEYLVNRKVNKRKFAKKCGISESALYKYINLEREPKLAIALRIHRASNKKVLIKDLLMDPQDAELYNKDEDLL